MSWKALRALMESPTCWSSPAQFAVLVVIADRTNDKGDARRGIPPGFAWPSKTTIAERIGVSPRYVPEVVRELQAAGCLEVQLGAGPRGANLYRLTLSTSASQFIPQETSTSVAQFIPRSGAERQPMNSGAGTDELCDTRDEQRRTSPVLSSSSELLRDPGKEPLDGSAASPHGDFLPPETEKRIKAIAIELVEGQYFPNIDALTGEVGRLLANEGTVLPSERISANLDLFWRGVTNGWNKNVRMARP